MKLNLNSIIYYTNQITYTYQSILNYFLIFFVIYFLSLHTPFGNHVEFKNSLGGIDVNLNIYSFSPFIFYHNTILQYSFPIIFLINFCYFYIIYSISWMKSFLVDRISEKIYIYVHHLVSLNFSIILYHYIYKSMIQPINDKIYLIQLYKMQFNIYIHEYIIKIIFIFILYLSFQWIQYLMYYINHLRYQNAVSYLMLNILIIELLYKIYLLYFYKSIFNINYIYLFYFIGILIIIFYMLVLLKSKFKYFYSLDLMLNQIEKLSFISSKYFEPKYDLNFKIFIFRVPYIYIGSFPLISFLFTVYFMNEVKYYLYINLLFSFIFLICILIFHNILFKSQIFNYKMKRVFLKLSSHNKLGIYNRNIFSPEIINIKKNTRKMNITYYIECMKRIQYYFSSSNYIIFVLCIFIFMGIINILYINNSSSLLEVVVLFKTNEILTNKISFMSTILINLYIIIRLYTYLKAFNWRTKKINQINIET